MDEYFIQRTDSRLEKIELKLDQLIGFRAWLFGASAAISAIIGVALHILFR
jgi:hypothetical protein